MFGNWFSKAVDRGVKAGIESGIKSIVAEHFGPGGMVEKMVEKAFYEDMEIKARENRRTTHNLILKGFLLEVAFELIRAGLKAKEALQMARETVAEFLKDEKIAYGAKGWDWTQAGAQTLAQENCIQYFEN